MPKPQASKAYPITFLTNSLQIKGCAILIKRFFRTFEDMKITDVNAHLHTPYSFSAFSSVEQALDMAASEGVKVVGINDFYTMDGYAEWSRECSKRKLCPMFNIEFISLNSEDQAAGLRVNDPNNPGRTYISGKGLAYPVRLAGEEARQLAEVRREANAQVEKMCAKLNAHLEAVGMDFRLDFGRLVEELSRGLLRERHLAKAIRLSVDEHQRRTGADRLAVYERIFGGSPLKSSIDDIPAVENEIRSKLLKSGGPAFVAEDPKAFLPMETVCGIIRAAGGIPTYPFLADDAKGHFTDFEGDLQKAADTLKRRGIDSVEFITTRNTTAVLEQYSDYLQDEGFTVTFGSEHNTPAMEPILLRTRDNDKLSEKLRTVNYRGACRVIAHQAGLDSIDAGDELIHRITD